LGAGRFTDHIDVTIAVLANTLHYPRGGGHRWAYLNWALGFRSNGCDVLWLEWVDHRSRVDLVENVAALRRDLEPHGLADAVTLVSSRESEDGMVTPDEMQDADTVAAKADLLVNFVYTLPHDIVRLFRRSALLDIDPGLLQIWMASGVLEVASHDHHFTIGETVGTSTALFPDAGRDWIYTPPCVALDAWPVTPSRLGASFSTITHWWSNEWVRDHTGWYLNDKRSGFLPFLDLPRRVQQPLQVASYFANPHDAAELETRGWHIPSVEVTSTASAYQAFIRASRGEFSCAKPSCVRLQNAWISDRTLCYLATGRPAVVQHTGPSRILRDACGVLRFKDIETAARCLREADRNHEAHARAARALAEEHFDARRVTRAILERALA
jgi:hypothetical protein